MKTDLDIYEIGYKTEKFNEEPHYGVYINTNKCSFEILLNDMLIIKHIDQSDLGLKGSYYPLNWNISKSGSQKFEIKLFPSFNQDINEPYKTLTSNSGVSLKVVRSVIKNKQFVDEQDIYNYRTPQKDVAGKMHSTFEEQPIFTDRFVIDIDVPFQINTLEQSEVLYFKDEEKQKELERKVVAKYNEIRNIYLNENKNQLANISYNKEKRIAQQLFLTSEEIEDRWNNDYQFRTDSNLEFFDLKPIENFQMKFYANGKLVCLEKINNGKSALWGGFKRKDKNLITTTYILIYLHCSKGSNKLEVY